MTAREASVCMVLTKRPQVSLYCSFQLFMPTKLNSPLLHFSNLGTRFHDEVLRFLHSGPQKFSFGHSGRIQRPGNIGLFRLGPTALSCHSSGQVKILQEISCCLKQWDSTATSTIYASVAYSKVITASLDHSWGPLSRNLSPNIPELTTSWCSILWTMQTHALVTHGGSMLWAAINWSRSSLRLPTARHMVSSWPFTSIWISCQPIACCLICLLHPVRRTIVEFASRVILSGAASAALHCTNWCLCCCCVRASASLDEAPIDRLVSYPLSPCWGVSVAMICRCGIGEEDDNAKKREVLRNI